VKHRNRKRPRTSFACADCGVCTLAIGEYYMVEDTLWEQAWAGRQRQGPELLCIGCLEARIGRSLVAGDFKRVPLNDPEGPEISTRMQDRLVADPPHG
jgi:hypothetical protein